MASITPIASRETGRVVRRGRQYVVPVLIGMFTILVYLPALRNGFVNWDDHNYIYNNVAIRTLDLDLIRWAFGEFHFSNWHPLAWFSHAVDYSLWGLDPFGHHLTSIMLHGCNTVLVFYLAHHFLQTAGGNAAGEERRDGRYRDERNFTIAVVAGTLFGIHPLHVESVAWVSERKDLLCALFYLLSLLSYLSFLDAAAVGRTAATRRHSYYGSSVVLFFFALLSKPMAVSLPIIMLLIDWCSLQTVRRRCSWKRLVLEKLPFFTLSILFSIITMLAQQSRGSVISTDQIPLLTRIFVASSALVSYAGKMVYPHELIAFYPHPRSIMPFALEYVIPFCLVLLVTFAVTISARRHRWLLAAWAYYLITLLPVLGIVQVGGQAMADRYTYLPSISLFMLAGAGAAWMIEKPFPRNARHLSVAYAPHLFLVILIVVYSSATVRQIAVWKDGVTLWTAVIESWSRDRKDKVVDASLPYINRAQALDMKGLHPAALADYDQAIKLAKTPNYTVYHMRGGILEKMGRFDEALDSYASAVKLRPEAPALRNSVGYLLGKLGRYDEAIQEYSRALALAADSPDTYFNRGNMHARSGRYLPAINDYSQAIRLSAAPQYDYYWNRGLAYQKLGRNQDSLRDLAQAELVARQKR